MCATFDKNFTWEREVKNKIWQSYYLIKNPEKVHKYLMQVATETMVHAFISTKRHYDNALLVGLLKCLINKLQYMKNSVAHIGICNANMNTLFLCTKKYIGYQFTMCFSWILMFILTNICI